MWTRRCRGRLRLGLVAWLLLVVAVGAHARTPAPWHISGAADHPTEVRPALAPQPPLPVPCPPLSGGEGIGLQLGQGLDGRLHSCVRVGHMPPGEHRVAVVALPLTGHTAFDSTLPLRITPDHAHPGATVHLSGEIPVPAHPRDYVDICWSSCDGRGLRLSAQEVRWAAGGHFDVELRVPATAWLDNSGPRPLRAGDVNVTIPCLSYDTPCTALVGHLHLVGPTPLQCLPGHPCARLNLSRRAARFGDEVDLGGFAPLTDIIGSQPFGYYLQIDPPPHRTRAKDGPLEFTLAEATLRTEPALPLHRSPPVRLQRDDGDQLATDPADPNRLALCQPEGIGVTEDGGTSWRMISVEGARRDAAASDYHLWPPDQWGTPPSCDEVTLDPAHPHSYFAAFSAVPQGGSAPPYFRVGYVTGDSGRTWRRVPTPPGETAGAFAGFMGAPDATLALFFTGAQWPRDSVLVEESRDGGVNWSPSQLRCPSTGGCVLFTGTQEIRGCAGPLGTPQLLEGSLEGARFSVLPYPATVNTCGLAELVMLQGGTELLLGGDWAFPVLVSSDHGSTWRVRGLPDLPNPASNTWSPYYPDLQMLPDGSLLAHGATWELLPPGASAWCAVSAQTLPPQQSGRLLVDGPRLWWIEAVEASGQVEHWRPRSVALAGIQCS